MDFTLPSSLLKSNLMVSNSESSQKSKFENHLRIIVSRNFRASYHTELSSPEVDFSSYYKVCLNLKEARAFVKITNFYFFVFAENGSTNVRNYRCLESRRTILSENNRKVLFLQILCLFLSTSE